MPDVIATVAIPTLLADETLRDCVASLARQTRRDFEVVVIDNSTSGAVARCGLAGVRVIENSRNVGFGTAINQAMQTSKAPYVVALNDDAIAHPEWIDGLIRAIENRHDVGMCASQVRFFGESRLDSAGMLLAPDGIAKQRGHGEPAEKFAVQQEVLFPSGSAALYRRTMLEEIGGFDDDFFLYCEDTDLGLRAHWAGWKCLYVPDAIVEHHYSHSTGGDSPLKAYLVERNRLFVLLKTFPASMLWSAPFAALARYFWHGVYLLRGKGSASRFRKGGNAGAKMMWYIMRAHGAFLQRIRPLMRERRRIRMTARISPTEFQQLVKSHSITSRKVAAL